MLSRIDKDQEAVTVFSLDYDGCSDILFFDIEQEFKDDGYDAKKKAYSLKNQLDGFLNKASEGSNIIEVYVGSNRQDRSDDAELAVHNENGSCFKNLDILCQEKMWDFKKLLLADVQNNVSAGTSVSDEDLFCNIPSKINKNEMIFNQLKDVRKNHPNEVVNFYFFDDKYNTILKNTYEYFKSNRDLFQNVNLIFIQFDWFDYVIENKPTLTEFARIEFPKEVLEKSAWNWRCVAGGVALLGLFAAVAYQARACFAEEDSVSPEGVLFRFDNYK